VCGHRWISSYEKDLSVRGAGVCVCFQVVTERKFLSSEAEAKENLMITSNMCVMRF